MSRPTAECRNEYYDVGMLVDDRLHLMEFIGSGGMACVYRAREDGTPHQYAVKFLKQQYHNQAYLVKFFNDEADNMRQLAHPNIVRFFRFVQNRDYSYIVMDYVDGFSLSDIIKRMYKDNAEIPIPEVVRIMTQVARALDAMHREGFVHRDIKPSNVLIARQTGQTFLSDLGITTKANIKIEGAGTIAYMPPEISATWTADHHADVYSFGIMFFEMLAKRRPFMPRAGMRGSVGENDITRQHREAPIPDITKFRPDLPAELNEMMRKALAKRPKDRYNSILDFARDVHEVLKPRLPDDMQDFATITHRHITAPTETLSPVNIGKPQGRPLVFVGLAFVGLLIIIVGIVVASQALPGTDDPVAVAELTEEVPTATVEQPTNTPLVITATPLPFTSTPTQADEAEAEPDENDEADEIAASQPTTTSTHTPTATHTPSPTDTPTPTLTPNPIIEQPIYPLVAGVDALAEPDEVDQLMVSTSGEAALRYLQVGNIDGFQVAWEVASIDNVAAYGLAFRIQDDENYLLFSIQPDANIWQVDDMVAGTRTERLQGSVPDDVDEIILAGREDFFQIILGDDITEFTAPEWPQTGALALWVDSRGNSSGIVQYELLAVALLGPEAEAAASASPTAIAVSANSLAPLSELVNNLISTNDVVNSTIDCPVYIDQYDRLEEFTVSTSDEVSDLATRITEVGQVIYARCRAESPDAPLSFVDAIQDYIDWETAINELADELDTP